MKKFKKSRKKTDPYWDPDELNKTRWFVVTIPFDLIAKAWKWIFQGKDSA